MTETTDKILGAGAGLAVYKGSKLLRKPYCELYRNKMSSYFSNEELQLLKKVTQDSFKKSGLKKHGISLLHLDFKNIDSFKKTYFQKLFSRLNLKSGNFLRNFLYKLKSKQFDCCANGKNAFFIQSEKKILINLDKYSHAGFHEMGHATNFASKGFPKFLQKIRGPFSLLAPMFLLIGLSKDKKQDGQKPKGFIDKTTDFIKNNAGKLSFIAMLPTIAEEGLASINGAKLAKNVLDKNLLKKINYKNVFGLSTYIVASLLSSVGIAAGIKVRDYIVEKKKPA